MRELEVPDPQVARNRVDEVIEIGETIDEGVGV